MTLLEVAKHALEAMEDAMYRADTHEFYDAKESLRYAIEQAEQAEQEPVLEVRCFGEKRVFVTLVPVEQLKDGEKLYRGLLQEKPVGYFRLEQGIWYQYHEDDAHPETLTPLYTAPTPRKPLTDELERKSDAIQRLWKERDELRSECRTLVRQNGEWQELNAELVEALRSVVAWMDAPDESAFSDMQLAAARAALAKAQGEQHE